MTTLRAVLEVFENAQMPLSMQEIALRLKLSPSMLEEMIGFWVRKGKLREVNGTSVCQTCGDGQDCPFITQLPRQYMLVTNEDEATIIPPCTCLTG